MSQTSHQEAVTATRPATAQGRITKRSSNACSRCRRQKIKCTGKYPCEACSRRKIPCQFDDYDQKVLVNKGYLISLQQKLASLERVEENGTEGEGDAQRQSGAEGQAGSDNAVYVAPFHDTPSTANSGESTTDPALLAQSLPDADSRSAHGLLFENTAREGNHHNVEASDVTSLTNPLSVGPSAFMTSSSGRTFYLGTSSNWSFTRRVLSMTHEFVHQSPIPSNNLLFDGETYDLKSYTNQDSISKENSAVPTVDYATHLVNSVKFHCGQLFHLFDEESFMRNLHDFYAEPKQDTTRTDLWYVHFLLILAFGKAFVTKTNRGRRPPGANFFCKALQLLPDAGVLWMDPVQSTELLCCLAMYYQCIDHRSPAYIYIGQAVRLAMSQGMHTHMPPGQLPDSHIQRCRKIWWTIYVLDREMTSLMGLPQAVRDEDVQAPLPAAEGDAFRSWAFTTRVKLSHFIANIDRTVYSPDGRPQRNFLPHTKDALARIADITDNLHTHFPLLLDDDTSCISRLSAHLHLLYHQCIALATRPLLFCFYRIRLDSSKASIELLNSSQTAQNLLNMCLDSSQQMITILTSLHNQGLLETFLPFDLEALVISTTNILIAPVLYPQTKASLTTWAQKAFVCFDELSKSGNLIAQIEQAELKQLGEMVESFLASEAVPQAHHVADALVAFSNNTSGIVPQETFGTATSDMALDDELFGAGFSAAQIMDMVNSINQDQSDWMLEEVVDKVL